MSKLCCTLLLSALAAAQSGPQPSWLPADEPRPSAAPHPGTDYDWPARDLDASGLPRSHAGFVSFEQLAIPRQAARAFSEALRLSDRGRPAEAIHKLSQALRDYPSFYEARVNLGVLHARAGDFAAAADEFERAALLSPWAALPQANLAVVLFHLGRLPAAERAARRAVYNDSRYLPGRYVLGAVLAATGRTAEALPHLQAAARAAIE